MLALLSSWYKIKKKQLSPPIGSLIKEKLLLTHLHCFFFLLPKNTMLKFLRPFLKRTNFTAQETEHS